MDSNANPEVEKRWKRVEKGTGWKRGHSTFSVYCFSFLGRPRGRSDDSRPSRAAVRLLQRSSPNGAPRAMLF
jgi:hypothetical protein